ncbi:MAG: sulfotransferase domain-containing protein [Parvibaculum sp.]|nr:sulfotransferase domain-containing protein [Parvibaculum sp.]|tara:strand:- start:1835 stop:2755 length:921 start_codon:yes stop_codon:yes gene_type:complete
MHSQSIAWPQKKRELHSNHFDSTVWNDFAFRDDDIIISTYAKSGTTWIQQIVSQLIFNGQVGLPVADMSPWLDLRVPPKEVKIGELEKQTHRRFIKTHLPVDALVFSPKVKYLYIGRDGRDVVWSLYNHHINANQSWYEALNDTPGLVGPAISKPVDSVLQYFDEWMARDGYPFWPFWENIRSWWAIRDLPNVHFLHFGNLKKDMPGEIRKIAAFLGISVDETRWTQILEHCSFDYMKANAAASVPLGGAFWDGGAATFVHKGVNGRWQGMLSPATSAAYEARAREELGEACAEWLLTGRNEPDRD